MKTKDMTLCALFTILYIIGSKLIIPAGIIPLTLQTMMVILAGLLLNNKQILASYGIYFIMGLLGLPVFASGGGISYVLQPSFGFLLSFPIAACLISTCKQHFHLQNFRTLFPVCLLGLLVIYTIGCVYMYGILNFYIGHATNFAAVLSMGAIPFMISDTLSISIACFCGVRLTHVSLIQRVTNA